MVARSLDKQIESAVEIEIARNQSGISVFREVQGGRKGAIALAEQYGPAALRGRIEAAEGGLIGHREIDLAVAVEITRHQGYGSRAGDITHRGQESAVALVGQDAAERHQVGFAVAV